MVLYTYSSALNLWMTSKNNTFIQFYLLNIDKLSTDQKSGLKENDIFKESNNSPELDLHSKHEYKFAPFFKKWEKILKRFFAIFFALA